MDVQPSLDRVGLSEAKLVILNSPYRKVITPILNYIWELEVKNPQNSVAVLIPQLVESRWYYSLLHNRRAAFLRSLLMLKGRNRILIINVPWNLEKNCRPNSSAVKNFGIFSVHKRKSFIMNSLNISYGRR